MQKGEGQQRARRLPRCSPPPPRLASPRRPTRSERSKATKPPAGSGEAGAAQQCPTLAAPHPSRWAAQLPPSLPSLSVDPNGGAGGAERRSGGARGPVLHSLQTWLQSSETPNELISLLAVGLEATLNRVAARNHTQPPTPSTPFPLVRPSVPARLRGARPPSGEGAGPVPAPSLPPPWPPSARLALRRPPMRPVGGLGRAPWSVRGPRAPSHKALRPLGGSSPVPGAPRRRLCALGPAVGRAERHSP